LKLDIVIPPIFSKIAPFLPFLYPKKSSKVELRVLFGSLGSDLGIIP
jgi:hypothetical protein